MSYIIRPVKAVEWEDAMGVAWRTFQKYEAPEYSQAGIDSFLDFISDENLYKMYVAGLYKVFVAVDDKRIIGIISLRKRNHISLLFVDSKYHRQGIGSALISFAAMYVIEEEGLGLLTVHAAPYAEEFYHKVGFIDVGGRTEEHGIIYTPMQYVYESDSSIV